MVVHDAVRPLVPLDVIQRSIEPILSGRADGDRHRDPERGHPRDRRGRRGRRDPRAEPVPPRPDAPDVPPGRPRAGLRGGDARGRPVRDRRLQPGPAARAGRPDRGRRGRRGERQDHDPDRHGHGRPDAPDEGARRRSRTPRPSASLEGHAAARRRRHERHRARDRRRGHAPRAPTRRSTAARSGLDVRDYASVEARLGAAAERLGGIDHVVCTAGILRIGSVADTPAHELAEVVDVNLTGHPQRRPRGLPVPARHRAGR